MEQFQDDVGRCKTVKTLNSSSFIDENMIKIFRESEEISVCEGQKPCPALKTDMILLFNYWMGSGTLPKVIVCEHGSSSAG